MGVTKADDQAPSDVNVVVPQAYDPYGGKKYGDREPQAYDAQIALDVIQKGDPSSEDKELCWQVIRSWSRGFRDVAGPEE
jgi:hypothetical protein